MKKLLLVAAAGLMVAGMTSCKKDFICACSEGGFSYSYTILESKKSAAQTACEGKGLGKIGDETGNDADAVSSNCTLSKK